MLELMPLVETGTRAMLGAVFGPTAEGETSYARGLLHLLTADMLVLWDKGFDSNAFLAEVTATGAKVLGRIKSSRRPPILERLSDGSYRSVIVGVLRAAPHHRGWSGPALGRSGTAPVSPISMT
jgi:hypothetical protein